MEIKIKKNYSDAYLNRGETYYKINNFKSAIKDLETSIIYDDEKDRGTLFFARLKTGNWNKINEQVDNLKKKILSTNFSILPFYSLSLTDSTFLQKKNFESFIYNLNIKKNISFNKKKKNKIKVGYISHDFMRHPVSQLISDTFKMHNKDKFDIYKFLVI